MYHSRSRSNSSTRTTPNTTSTALTPTSTNIVDSANSNSQLMSQLNITLNCHYCWAQFQLNVTKNLSKLNTSIQQKENGKYMQHLALHLNAPYKCNECSYPITDTKTFFKHKQFYKHDEKSCIMVDNDISSSTTSTTTVSTRRKTLIATRLRQHQQTLQLQQQQQQSESGSVNENVKIFFFFFFFFRKIISINF